MKPNEKRSERNTDTTYAVERPIHLSPSKQLELEADDALDAMKAVLRDMRTTAAEGLDPRKVTAEHPWVAMGAAAAAGFVGALVAVPSRRASALKRLERIERALETPSERDHESPNGHEKKGRTLVSTVLGKLYEAVKPMLLATLTSTITARAAAGGSDGYAEGGAEEL